MTHAETREHLEAYALGALTDAQRAGVERHLSECAACHTEALEWERIVDAIPEAVGERAPSTALRGRILNAARVDLAGTRRRELPRLSAAWLAAAALVLLTTGSLAFAIETRRESDALRARLADAAQIVQKVSQGGRWWYMSGTEAFKSSGGTLIDPRTDGAAFVLFHDLEPLAAERRYTIWMIRGDGSWVRSANFRPSGERLQKVDVPLAISEFVKCAITVEAAESGPRRGPLAMESRVFGQ